jgi:Rrf2 family protein
VLRALIDGTRKSASEICEQEALPQQFVYRILKKMEKGGLVKITRGKDGGATLNCDLKAVSLYDLLIIIGDKPYINDCMKEGYQCERRFKTGQVCLAHKHIVEVQNDLDKILKKRSLYYMLLEDDSE